MPTQPDTSQTSQASQAGAHIRMRRELLARLMVERAGLLQQFLGLGEETLTTVAVMDRWTAKDLLAHIAYWDAFQAARITLTLENRLDASQPMGGKVDLDARNVEVYGRFKEIPLEGALAMLLKERGGFLAALKRVPDAHLWQEIEMPWGLRTRIADWARWRHEHDAEHARHLKAWRERMPETLPTDVAGPDYFLRESLHATRKAFASVVTLFDEVG